ncbi:PKD domain-containing protein [Aquimarina algiphila]|uniref:PKD domain-containing protein n=1 Tax=Aquimarina algiphila TaxID=2047982 RepID=UPI00249118BC|nr:PKD domain-containing protein [Aquimarina algiphila]
MKIIKSLVFVIVATFIFSGCNEDEDPIVFQEIAPPTEVTANFNVTQDDTGLVTITPSGVSVSSFQIYFGDVENEEPTIILPGGTAEHIYSEGTYTVKIVGVGTTGLISEFLQEVIVSFRAPENLLVTIDQSVINPAIITVGASADFATLFDVYFGDVVDETPTIIMPGETVEHTYQSPGDYTVRVIARGGGIATIESTQVVTVPIANDPIVLPITFDSPTVNYQFVTFNGASFEVLDNPELSGVNSQASKVGAITNAGVNFEGGSFNLGTPVDFSGTNKTITMKFWSNVTVPILLKFEGGVSGERQNEVVANHGGTGWEELSFDFATDATKSFIDGSQGVGEPFVPTGQYATMVIFVDGPGTTSGTFYIDDIEQPGGEQTLLELPITFDSSLVTYDFGTFNGASYEVLDNPDLSGVNSQASKVGAITNAGVNFEGGAFNLETPVDFGGTNKTITIKFWANVAVPILLKFEGGVSGERQNEVIANHGGTGWEELSFDFATDATKSFIDGSQGVGEPFVPTGQYTTMVIFVDGPGTTSGVFYIDDLKQID